MEYANRELLGDPLAEAYQQNHYEIVELLGRLSAQAATNYRTERPRSPDHIGKQEEAIAALGDVLDLMGCKFNNREEE